MSVINRLVVVCSDSPASHDSISKAMHSIRMRHTLSKMTVVNCVCGVSVLVVLKDYLVVLRVEDPEEVQRPLLRGRRGTREQGSKFGR